MGNKEGEHQPLVVLARLGWAFFGLFNAASFVLSAYFGFPRRSTQQSLICIHDKQ
jgi:hypothetical protein